MILDFSFFMQKEMHQILLFSAEEICRWKSNLLSLVLHSNIRYCLQRDMQHFSRELFGYELVYFLVKIKQKLCIFANGT